MFAGLIAIAIVLAIGAVMAATMRHPPDPELVGKGTFYLALSVGFAAYLVARRRK
ncbi:MAG: hypothetical protein K8W52_23960 [Deltaproteobacteria bacterium]|nr:hypothetical protein [Deltaproteobacteria bacterium]